MNTQKGLRFVEGVHAGRATDALTVMKAQIKDNLIIRRVSDRSEFLWLPYFLRRDQTKAKKEHLQAIKNGDPCSCCNGANRCISEPTQSKTTKKPKAKAHPAVVYLVGLVG